MSTKCCKSFNLTITGLEDIPLDQAVYVPAVGPRAEFIAAVFGGTIYHFNAVTGVKVSQSRFAPTGMSPACLTYEPNLDRILAAVWNDPGIGIAADGSVLDFRYIYYINPATLAVTSTRNIWADFYGYGASTPPCPNPVEQTYGIRTLEYKSGKVYATAILPYLNTRAEALQFNAANPPVGFIRSAFTSSGTVWSTGSADTLGGTREIMWVGDQESGFIWGFDILGGGADDVHTVFEPPFNPYGVAFDPAGVLWVGYLNGRIKKFNISALGVTPPLMLTVDLLRPNFTAFFVRYNPYNGKVYAAGYADNTVAEITPPATGLVKTGFDLPLDLVFTPTKIFAVQHGSVGLKEVT